MHVKTCRRDHTSAGLFKLEKLVVQAEKFLTYDKKNIIFVIVWLIFLSGLSSADTVKHLLDMEQKQIQALVQTLGNLLQDTGFAISPFLAIWFAGFGFSFY